jgi:YVTN family beta-propeller protein
MHVRPRPAFRSLPALADLARILPALLTAVLSVLFAAPAAGQSFLANVTVGSTPNAVGVNPVTDKIYVANAGSGTVTAIDGATGVKSTVNVGSDPEALAVSAVTGMVYVANTNSNTVTVINGAPPR